MEYCSGLICASLMHLKPLVERLLPGLLGVSRADLNRSRRIPQKSARTGEHTLETKASIKRKLDPYAYWITTAVRANTLEHGATSEDGIRITNDIFITSEPNPSLAVPAKVMQRCKTVIYSRVGMVSSPPSPVGSCTQ